MIRVYLPRLGNYDDDWLTVKQCADILGVTEETVRSYTKASVEIKGKIDINATGDGLEQKQETVRHEPALPSVKLDVTKIPRKALVAFANRRAEGITFYDPKDKWVVELPNGGGRIRGEAWEDPEDFGE